ncbi:MULTISPECIES: TMEM175 family protein [unclassified Pseudonocardia]|uniref:TMEM175 family protein n=1 Tax=unclassified Pseudonocardia TaxID=2619320 RepID=UPI0001FFEA71|nr:MULTISPECIES: TMEM175 family protein [unclassified Pseudonocardia]OLL92816.1 Integral membrane protein [Pseudonocardia sp. Ae356_Ps1]OLM19295.1 Integral membrane protein [Pseudonocardia sp. Ae707_Ps1]
MTTIRPDGTRLERITAFSDGVFAIAITLLVLPLTDTVLSDDRIGPQLLDLLPRMLTFALSFVVIGRYWMFHHQLFDRFVRADRRLMSLNLAYLFGIAFLPFPTSALGEHGARTAAVVLYAANLIVIGLASAAIWWHASSGGRLTGPEVTPAAARATLIHGLAPVVALVPSIPIAFVAPAAAMFSWLLILPVSVLADRLFPDPAG